MGFCVEGREREEAGNLLVENEVQDRRRPLEHTALAWGLLCLNYLHHHLKSQIP